MKVWRSAAIAVSVAVVVGFPTVSAGPVTAKPTRSAGENGPSVTVPAAPAKLKPAKCKAANRPVKIAASASKKIKGRYYGVQATRTLSLCTTRKNQTKVFAESLSLKPVNGLVKVAVAAGATTRVVRNGTTTLTTPLTAKSKFLFKTYRVTGRLRTVVDRYGKVTSQVVDVARS